MREKSGTTRSKAPRGLPGFFKKIYLDAMEGFKVDLGLGLWGISWSYFGRFGYENMNLLERNGQSYYPTIKNRRKSLEILQFLFFGAAPQEPYTFRKGLIRPLRALSGP